MKIGHKLYVGTFTDLEYFNCAQWCNKNNAYMKDCRDKGFWEICEVEKPSLQEQNDMKITELKEYLYQTDWYVTRFWETGINIPDEVKKKRAEIRKQISLLKGELL